MCVVPPLFAIQLTLDDLMGQRPWFDIGNHPVTLKVKPFACGSEVDFTRRVAALQHRRLSENPLRVTCLRQRLCEVTHTIVREIPRVNNLRDYRSLFPRAKQRDIQCVRVARPAAANTDATTTRQGCAAWSLATC